MKTALLSKADHLVKFLSAQDKQPFIRLARNNAGGIILDKKGMPLVEMFVDGAIKEVMEDNTIVHYISTPRIDPVRDVMDPYGMNAQRLDKNRSIFYNHRWSGAQDLPIGQNLWTRPERGGVLAKTEYAVEEREDGFARVIFNLAKNGYLNSYSIGFFPENYSFVSIADLGKLVGNKFDIANLAEFSAEDQVCYHSKWNMYE